MLTSQELIRTRKISSRISNKEVTFFVENAVMAPSNNAPADPEGKSFAAMTDLYWYFAGSAPKRVSFAKIPKVLHLEQPGLFPILDSHLVRSYAPAARVLRMDYPQFGWWRRTQLAIRNDLLGARSSGALNELRQCLRAYEPDDIEKPHEVRLQGGLTDLHLLDILVWQQSQSSRDDRRPQR